MLEGISKVTANLNFDFSEENAVLWDVLVREAKDRAGFGGRGENNEKAEEKTFSFPNANSYVERWSDGEDSSCSWSYFVGQVFFTVTNTSRLMYGSRKFAFFPSPRDGNNVRSRKGGLEPIDGEEDSECDVGRLWVAVEKVVAAIADGKAPRKAGLVVVNAITDLVRT